MINTTLKRSQQWPPLQERVVRTATKRAQAIASTIEISSGACMLTSKSHGKTKEWTEEQTESALKDVTTGSLSVKRAALKYQVPCSTLSD